jgi:hypothetical protein
MSIPLDRLYYYIENIAQEVRQGDIVIYRFSPHGSKNIEDLSSIRKVDYFMNSVAPQIYCNDQEPLNYDYYEDNLHMTPKWKNLFLDHGFDFENINFRRGYQNIYDRLVLLHSEQRSAEVEKYQKGQWITAYYWSHAIIARDWFRYAKHINLKKKVNKTFLIYNRAWSGTREYRLRFAEYLFRYGLIEHCKTFVTPIDEAVGVHYENHKFLNETWKPTLPIHGFFPKSWADSHSSADFSKEDYEETDIEVVLETLFDDTRLQLTEKTLRPIAVGQPFILASTHGSLEYLRSYGFKTFNSVWDESYDVIEDSHDRMVKIIETMEVIAGWSDSERESKMSMINSIVAHNKQHFFSNEFQNQVVGELRCNLHSALIEMEETNTSARFLEWRKKTSQVSTIREVMMEALPRSTLATIIKTARQYYIRSLKHTT